MNSTTSRKYLLGLVNNGSWAVDELALMINWCPFATIWEVLHILFICQRIELKYWIKFESASMLMNIWNRRLLTSESALIMFVEAANGHTKVPKAMHEAWDLRHLACAANWKTQLVSCDLRYLECAANWEAQLGLCELGPCPEMVFGNQALTRTCCSFVWCICLDPKINWKVNGILLLIPSRRKVLNSLFEKAFDNQSTDTTTNWNVE